MRSERLTRILNVHRTLGGKHDHDGLGRSWKPLSGYGRLLG